MQLVQTLPVSEPRAAKCVRAIEMAVGRQASEPTEDHLWDFDLLGWPQETRIDDDAKRRQPRPLGDFESERLAVCERLKEHGGTFTKGELIGGRLYTGPLFVKYNAVSPSITCTRTTPRAHRASCHGRT